MNIDDQNYELMRAWFARIVPEVFPPQLLPPETNPIAHLDKIAARSMRDARAGLSMAIHDIVSDTHDWPVEAVTAIDGLLQADGLPSLSEMRIRFSKVIRRVVARGKIKSDAEYYAVRNAAEQADGNAELWQLIAAYEDMSAP